MAEGKAHETHCDQGLRQHKLKGSPPVETDQATDYGNSGQAECKVCHLVRPKHVLNVDGRVARQGL